MNSASGFPAGASAGGDRSDAVRAAAIVFIVVPTLALGLRFWYRAIERRLWWDDLFIALSLVFSNALQAGCLYWVSIGFGRHIFTIPKDRLPHILALSTTEVHLYITSITFLKLAALVSYAFFFKVKRTFRYCLWFLAVVVTAWWITMILQLWLKCSPPTKIYKPWLPGKCHTNGLAWNASQSTINFVLDLVILGLPVPLIYKLHLKTARKLQVAIIFLLGYCSAFISLARLALILSNPGRYVYSKDPDVTYVTVPLFMLSMAEAPVGLLALCIIPVVGLCKRYKQRLYGRKPYRPENIDMLDTSTKDSGRWFLLRSLKDRVRSTLRGSRSNSENSESKWRSQSTLPAGTQHHERDQDSDQQSYMKPSDRHIIVRTDISSERLDGQLGSERHGSNHSQQAYSPPWAPVPDNRVRTGSKA